MIELSRFLMLYVNLVNAYIPTPPRGQSNLGYLILSIIVSPVIILLLASVLGRPRKRNITILFLGFLVFMLGAFITITYVLGIVTGLFF